MTIHNLINYKVEIYNLNLLKIHAFLITGYKLTIHNYAVNNKRSLHISEESKITFMYELIGRSKQL